MLIIVDSAVTALSWGESTLRGTAVATYLHESIFEVATLTAFLMAGYISLSFFTFREVELLEWSRALAGTELVLQIIFMATELIVSIQTKGVIGWFKQHWDLSMQILIILPFIHFREVKFVKPRLSAVLNVAISAVVIFSGLRAKPVLQLVNPMVEPSPSNNQLIFLVLMGLWCLIAVQMTRGWQILASRIYNINPILE